MNLSGLFSPQVLGLLLVAVFFVLILAFAFRQRLKTSRDLREIPAFIRLGRAVGRAVEAGQRLHVSLGRGGINGVPAGSALIGLTMLQRITRAASVSDRPPVATSGNAVLAMLSQDSLRSTYRSVGAEGQFDPTSGQLTGLTPFSYAAGAMAEIFDQQVAASVLAGHFGSEAALITDAAERSGSLTLGGSDSITGQAVLFATAQEPLVGEELYAAGAYLQAGDVHTASLHAQDVIRWGLVATILAGALLKFLGVL